MSAGGIPQIFDRGLARARLSRAVAQGFEPFLLQRAVADALERLSTVKRDFAHALDLGTPTAALADALSAQGRLQRTTRAAPALLRGRETLVASEEALPFAPGVFDLALSLLSLQGANDLPGALTQIRLSLKPDGLFLAALLGRETLTELRQCLIAAESEIAGGASPRVAPFADVRDMGGLLQRAGFALPVTDVERIIVRYGDMFSLLRDLRRMGLTNALVERSRKPLTRAALFRAAAIYAGRFADGDGRLRATFDLVWLSGWAPHDSQQKPLRPGSAKSRLADALGTPELSTGEKAGS